MQADGLGDTGSRTRRVIEWGRAFAPQATAPLTHHHPHQGNTMIDPTEDKIIHDDTVRSMSITNEPSPPPTPTGNQINRWHPLIEAIHEHEDRVHQGKTPD